MNNLFLETKIGCSVLFTHRLANNNVLESLGNACLKPIRKKNVYLADEKYFIVKYFPYFKDKRIERAFTCLKGIGLITTGIGVIGISLKVVSWLNADVRKKNINYIKFKIEQKKQVEQILPIGKKQLENSSLLKEDLFSSFLRDLKILIISYLEIDDLKNMSLVSKRWRNICTVTMIYQKTLMEIYPKSWIEVLKINALVNIPRIQLNSDGLLFISNSVRQLELKQMKSYSIVQGSKDGVYFIAIRYFSLANSKEGVVVWNRPYDVLTDKHQSWANASALADIDKLGNELTDQSNRSGQDAFLNYLKNHLSLN